MGMSPVPKAGMEGMVVKYRRGRTWERRPHASINKARSSMLMTELRVVRTVWRVEGRGEVAM